METMNIALPDSMKHFVQDRVSEGGYSSVSEYVRDLIRSDQRRKAEERIDALLLEGLDSGPPIPVTPEYWEEKKRKLTERLAKAIQPQ
jgi:antitoxin ParD1/3/4